MLRVTKKENRDSVRLGQLGFYNDDASDNPTHIFYSNGGRGQVYPRKWQLLYWGYTNAIASLIVAVLSPLWVAWQTIWV